jgi:anti-sigma B factor antagonist
MEFHGTRRTKERLAPRYRLQASHAGKTETISVAGELDLATASRLDQAIRNAEAGSTTRIVVDLSETTFIDRPALVMLLKARVRLRNRGDRLKFVPSTSEQVRRFIALTGTSEMLY